jgi:hypothetical protein
MRDRTGMFERRMHLRRHHLHGLLFQWDLRRID